MELDDILKDEKKEEVKDPVEKTIQEGEERVENRRRKFQEKEWDARAEGEGKKRDPVTGQWLPKEEKDTVEAASGKDTVEAEKPDKIETPKEAPKQDFSERERAFLATAQEERRKRQEIEQQLEQYKKQPPEPPKPFFEDPDGHLARYQQELQAANERFAQMIFQTKLQNAEEIARVKYQDYDQVVEVFKEVAAQAPGLVQQCMASQNPAEFAYKLGKHHKDMREVGSIDAYKQKVEKELRAKLEAELKQKFEQEMKARQNLVPSLSDARYTQANKAVWGGPTPLDNILGS